MPAGRFAGLVGTAVLVACGGGSGGEIETTTTGSATVAAEVPRARATGLPNVPSGYVRYVGEFWKLDEQGRRVGFYRSLYDQNLASCNLVRTAIHNLPAQSPELPADVWYDADHDTRSVMYDGATGASRIEYRHAYPEVVMPPDFMAVPPDCALWRLRYRHYTTIVSSDGNTYRSDYDPATGVNRRMVGSRTGPRLMTDLAWSSSWEQRTIAAQPCMVIPSVGSSLLGAQHCRWTPFVQVKFGVLPLNLEVIDRLGVFDHRWVAEWASHDGLDRGPGFGLPTIDALPTGVPVVMSSDPPPADESDDES
ncbi:MAG TPA: hypothetical protein VFR90_03995 [Methylibium sp.]|uniref:hypothetical protein n=1 Tax=Methylibium sp. TaxID=2067992 RepID=UPI002DBE811C|nr:hypothetical protein [Methylibium sp.]HEU4458261.1 hypothetical protein [Methylibium sp.]